eukprot:TRINITY_DN3431_c0_g1_i1.p1 TRINITY_DN3431_c0_g1~~TRINITY_DN3431_c0_g1_i1.p1  ORF type:complete len:231 (-),score=54.60 TRINITY_DN3431_c0_g1_i1:302-955(-)
MKKVPLPPLPTVGDLIRLYGLSANQRLSQNFLLDLNITNRIVSCAGDLSQSTVIEIGAGPGSLTRSLLQLGAKRVIAVEKDARFLPVLELLEQSSQGRLTVIHGDMLKLDEEEILEPYKPHKDTVKMMGNLPFNVATDLTLKWLNLCHQKKGPFIYGKVPMILLFQKEVGERLSANVKSAAYSRLSVMAGRLCQIKVPFIVKGSAFVPEPDVFSDDS